MPFLHILLLGFSSAVIAVWIKHHFIMLPDNQLSIGFPFFIAGSLIALTLFFSFQYFRKHPTFHFHFRPIFILPIVFLLGAIIFNTQAFFRGLIFANEPIIPLASWASANLSFATKFGSVILTYALLTVAFFAAGNRILRTIQRHPAEDPYTVYGIALRIITGMCAWSTFLVGLGFIEALNSTPLWIMFFLLFFSEYPSLRVLSKKIQTAFEYRLNWKSPELYLFTLTCFLIAFTFTQSLRPHPTGYDDMTFYMDRAYALSEERSLISGGLPYPFELMVAAIRIAADDESLFLGMSLATYALFFGAVVLYGFGRDCFNHRTGFLAAAILLSLPIGAALTIREVKPDPLLFAVSALALWSLLRSLTERKLFFWYAGLGLCSFAISIKMTGLFLIAPLSITAGIIALQRKSFGVSWQAIAPTILFSTLPLLPWIGYGLTTHSLSSAFSSFQAFISSESVSEYQKLRSEVSLYAWNNSCESSGSAEDFSRFATHRQSTERWIALPWDLTMNTTTASFATEIGFFFLALLPFWMLRQRETKSEEDKEWSLQPTRLISFFALGYFALWIWVGQGVIWYGYPGLSLLILLVALLESRLKSDRILSAFFWVVILFGLTANTLVQMKLKAERAQILFAGGQLAAGEFLEQSIAGYGGALKILNQDPTSRIILTSSQLWYGIIDNSKRAVMDSYLDRFNCLYRERDDALTLSRLQELNIRYVLYARGYTAELETGKRETFKAKIQAFTDFLGKNLRVVWGSPYYTIFEVPGVAESSP